MNLLFSLNVSGGNESPSYSVVIYFIYNEGGIDLLHVYSNSRVVFMGLLASLVHPHLNIQVSNN